MMCRLPVKRSSKVLFCGITTLQIRPYLGTSKCWGHSVLQTPALVSFRSRTHRLPVETGRWQNIEFHERSCTLCLNATGDIFHSILGCDKLKEQRKDFLKAWYYKRPNIIKYESLMNSKNKKLLISVSKFINVIYDICKTNSAE